MDQRQRIHVLVDSFFDRPVVHKHVVRMLEKLLMDDPPFQEPSQLIPVDEAEIRCEYARNIRKEIRKQLPSYDLDAQAVALIMTVPLSALKPDGRLSTTQGSSGLLAQLAGASALTKHFLQSWSIKAQSDFLTSVGESLSPKSGSRKSARISSGKKRPITPTQQPEALYESDDNGASDDHSDHQPSKSYRKKSEINKCLERDDYACVVMGTNYPEVCHIVPKAWNDSQRNITLTRANIGSTGVIMGEDWSNQFVRHLVDPEHQGSSDRVWNMLCLNLQLHKWWPKCYFAFKCLGIEPDTDSKSGAIVSLQFHWLPRNYEKPSRKMNLDGANNDWKTLVDDVTKFQLDHRPPDCTKGIIGASKAATTRPIISGQVIYVRMDMSDAILFRGMIELQWAISVLSAISGAAGAPEDLPDIFEPWGGFDDAKPWDVEASALSDVSSRVLPWVQDQAKTWSKEPTKQATPPPPIDSPKPTAEPSLLPLRPIPQIPQDGSTSPNKLSQRTQQVVATQRHSTQVLSENTRPEIMREESEELEDERYG